MYYMLRARKDAGAVSARSAINALAVFARYFCVCFPVPPESKSERRAEIFCVTNMCDIIYQDANPNPINMGDRLYQDAR